MTFVPPGARANPYPLGTTVRLDGAWRLTVNAAALDADAQVDGLNPPPPAGSQYALVNVSLTYVGPGTRTSRATSKTGSEPSGPGTSATSSAAPPPLDLSAVPDASARVSR